MLCKKPFMHGILPVGCSQCLPCRINRRRLWTHRMLLESCKHTHCSFVTLTYDEKTLPPGSSLAPKHTQKFFKRLRKAISPQKIRYYLVGEYGDHTWRPHYHLALFGLGIEHTEIINKCWGLGYTMVGDLTLASAQYVAGYVTKKLTTVKQDYKGQLKGRHPEFARMSRRPGIGATCVDEIANVLTSTHGPTILINNRDVPRNLQHGASSMPLGRYLCGLLRKKVGNPDIIAQENKVKYAEEMRFLLQDSRLDPRNKNKSLQAIIVEQNRQRVLNLESRNRISCKKGKL